jgi:ribosomal protein S4E
MKKFYGKTVMIDSIKLKADIHNLPKTMRSSQHISKNVLGKGVTYLDYCFHKQGMNKDCLEKLCGVFGFNMNDYIVVSEPEPEVVEELDVTEPINVVMESTPQQFDMSGVINAINSLTKAVDQLVAVETATQHKIESIERRLAKIESAATKTSEVVELGLDSIDEGVAELKSKLNIVNGRLGDMNRGNECGIGA